MSERELAQWIAYFQAIDSWPEGYRDDIRAEQIDKAHRRGAISDDLEVKLTEFFKL